MAKAVKFRDHSTYHSLVVNTSSELGLSKTRRVLEIKGLLEKRPDAVQDVDARTGRCALQRALYYRHVDVVKVLLAAGADSFCEEDQGFPAIASALFSLQIATIRFVRILRPFYDCRHSMMIIISLISTGLFWVSVP
jgi:ankyrin repeat protein